MKEGGKRTLGGLIQEINRQLTWEDNNTKTAILQHCERNTEEQWLLLLFKENQKQSLTYPSN